MGTSYENLKSDLEVYLYSYEIEKVHKAYLYASLAHEGQFRKSGTPYISHPISVAGILAKQKMPTPIIIAGLLHDVIEDTDITEEEMAKEFGQDVVNIVSGVTKLGNIEGLSKAQIKSENHRRLILATAQDIRVIIVKLADRLHNMKTIEYMNEIKQKLVASETLEVYTPIAHRLGMYGIKWELEDLCFKCINHEKYVEISDKVKEISGERSQNLKNINTELEKILEKNNIQYIIKCRTKSMYSIYNSMQKHNKKFEELTDILGFRILVDSKEMCYITLGLIHSNYKPIPLRFKDYIPTPKHNFYQSIHTTILTNDGVPIEFQIRTYEMDQVAEYGAAAHWMYKEDVNYEEVQNCIDAQAKWLIEAREGIDNSDYVSVIKKDFIDSSIIIYSSGGDVFELPVSSTVLDFAFLIHTDIGLRAVGAKVNGVTVGLFYHLKVGDVVEVLTSKYAEPSMTYIPKLKTRRAINALKKFFKNEHDYSIAKTGKEALLTEAQKNGIVAMNVIITADVIEYFGCESEEEFLYEIGNGDIKCEQVISYIVSSIVEAPKLLENSEVLINGIEPENYRFCRTCSPIHGEDAIIENRVNEVTGLSQYIIHRNNDHYEGDVIPMTWNEKCKNRDSVARVYFTIDDGVGTLSELMDVMNEFQFNITSIQYRGSIGEFGNGKMSFRIKNIDEYNKLEQVLKQNKIVKTIKRTKLSEYE